MCETSHHYLKVSLVIYRTFELVQCSWHYITVDGETYKRICTYNYSDSASRLHTYGISTKAILNLDFCFRICIYCIEIMHIQIRCQVVHLHASSFSQHMPLRHVPFATFCV